ncbi:MAG: 6-carboxytetrahydropterin synthase [Nitrosopumilus sp.]|nr:6-carboxytetrahydropterin synthase [Nitrosopumilus sp.]
MLKITKIYNIEMAHRLFNYDGACCNIHGHSYKLEVTIGGVLDKQNGFLLDFKDLKNIIMAVTAPLDHALIISEDDPLISEIKNLMLKIVIVDYIPTAENIVTNLWQLFRLGLRNHDNLNWLNIRLWETSSAYAEYGASI